MIQLKLLTTMTPLPLPDYLLPRAIIGSFLRLPSSIYPAIILPRFYLPKGLGEMEK